MHVLIDEGYSAIRKITLGAVSELELPEETVAHDIRERATSVVLVWRPK